MDSKWTLKDSQNELKIDENGKKVYPKNGPKMDKNEQN